jgi:hypothetical protein
MTRTITVANIAKSLSRCDVIAMLTPDVAWGQLSVDVRIQTLFKVNMQTVAVVFLARASS